MNAIPPDFHASGFPAGDLRADPALDLGINTASGLGARWTALAGAARVVAHLAQPHATGDLDMALTLPLTLDHAPGGRRLLIEQGIDDMLAMMEPGLTALLAVHQRGGQTAPAARALWQEFLRARRGLAALAPIRPVAD